MHPLLVANNWYPCYSKPDDASVADIELQPGVPQSRFGAEDSRQHVPNKTPLPTPRSPKGTLTLVSANNVMPNTVPAHNLDTTHKVWTFIYSKLLKQYENNQWPRNLQWSVTKTSLLLLHSKFFFTIIMVIFPSLYEVLTITCKKILFAVFSSCTARRIRPDRLLYPLELPEESDPIACCVLLNCQKNPTRSRPVSSWTARRIRPDRVLCPLELPEESDPIACCILLNCQKNSTRSRAVSSWTARRIWSMLYPLHELPEEFDPIACCILFMNCQKNLIDAVSTSWTARRIWLLAVFTLFITANHSCPFHNLLTLHHLLISFNYCVTATTTVTACSTCL
jgi:hypothetical protein